MQVTRDQKMKHLLLPCWLEVQKAGRDIDTLTMVKYIEELDIPALADITGYIFHNYIFLPLHAIYIQRAQPGILELIFVSLSIDLLR